MNRSQKKRMVRGLVARESADSSRLVGRIWELAEAPTEEKESARLLVDYLKSRGFRVTFPYKALPTAFKAVRGTGGPVIGILGEYDALPDCGAKAGAWGHGCGHNALGTAAAVGAVAAAEMLESRGTCGTVVFWGCPAEESLAGKVYMARDGAFRRMDACLCWHPSSDTRVKAAGGAALDSILLEFFGKTAHGASAHGGRSALDAALLTDVAVNYLREHVEENVRMHSVIRAGGKAPNVVPEYAKTWYYTRGKDRAQVDDVTRRLMLCARGAVLATETRLRKTVLTAMYSRLQNDAMAELVRENLALFGAPRATRADLRRLKKLGRKKPEYNTKVAKEVCKEQGRASSDEDTVSWLAPLGGFTVTCVAKGTTGHHREYTAQMNLPYAHRATLHAAQVFAGLTWDLCTQPKRLRKIAAEFRRKTKGFRFDPLVSKGQRLPPANP